MTDVVLGIDVGQGVALPQNPAPPASTPFEVAFDRSIGNDEAGQPLPPIRDVVGGTVDASLNGSVAVPDPVPGTNAEIRFLSRGGAIKESVNVRVPAANAAFQLTLNAAQVTAIIAPDPRPADLPTYVRRDGRFVPIDGATVDFAALSLAVAPITVGGQGWTTLGLDRLFNLQAAATTAAPASGTLPPALSALPWAPIHLGIDGQFVAQFVEGAGDAWIWWLTGPAGALGVVIDSLKDPVGLIPIALPPMVTVGAPTGAGTTQPPVDASEREIVDNPGIYTEDPGAFCAPFDNPERVLSERSFSVIYRAEQPVVSPEASFRTVTQPILDFELPSAVRDAVLTEVDTRPSIGRRIAATFRLAPNVNEARASVATIRPPAVDAIVTRDELPAGLFDEIRRADRGRRVVDAQNPVQWDSDASRYQAVTVARGHILEFRLRWRSNGYSLGTVAKTLTLAARQVRRIQKIEWRRLERARREERTQLVDRVADSVTRDRQYDDGVEATLSEWSRGESESSSSAAAGGFGFAMAGFLIGGGGGGSSASSSSSQQGGRRTTASEEQRLRDTIRRYGDSLRRLDSVVVNEVTQEEEVTGTSEVVRNPNFGHSLTVIYYQILRHLKVETVFAGVRECLFVPFAIKPFTVARAFRWRDLIRRGLLDRRFEQAIRYLKDVLTGFVGSEIPPGPRSLQRIRYVSGSLYLNLAIERPRDTSDGGFDAAAWVVLNPFLGLPAAGIFSQLRELAEARRDRQFQEEHAPGIAARWVNTLQVQAGSAVLAADMTLATRYQFNGTVRVDFSAPVSMLLNREMLASIRVRAMRDLPPNSVANLTRVSVTYQTDHFSRTFTVSQGSGDLVSPQTGVRDAGATIFALPDPWERQDVRAEMVRAVNDLIGHLNEHAEHYHKVIWWNMDRDRIFMLVDGFQVPGGNGRSIGSVIERDPIAIVGNSLVFRVSAGAFLGLGDLDDPMKLYNYYATHQPVADPMLISLPTDGLYAQTIMDKCEALEEHYGSTDWVLSDREPEVADIDVGLLSSRRAEPQPTTPSPFPATLINLQNAPEAPAPAGLAGVLNAVTNPNAFRDMAGLAGTQANAAAALQTAAALATNFGNQAAALKLAQMAKAAQATGTADQRLATVQRAVAKDLSTTDDAKRHGNAILEELHGPTSSPPHQETSFDDAIKALTGPRGGTAEAMTPDGSVRVMLASANLTPVTRCGFPDQGGQTRTLDEVKEEVVSRGFMERGNWVRFDATTMNVVMDTESRDEQFEHLVRYWLHLRKDIVGLNLTHIEAQLLDHTITPANKFLHLLGPLGTSQNTVNADARTIAQRFLVGIPVPGTAAQLAQLQNAVEWALTRARLSRLGDQMPDNDPDQRPWSAGFVLTCVRAAELILNLEDSMGNARNLLESPLGRHWEYVKVAHIRRFGRLLPGGTFDLSYARSAAYHAFEPHERPVQRGDIIVQDRRDVDAAHVWDFDDSQSNEGDMHGDIVVEVVTGVPNPYAETFGGNLGGSVKRRRYPLTSDARLVVSDQENYRNETNNVTIQNLPAHLAAAPAGDLPSLSTRRIFALLSLVEECTTTTTPAPAQSSTGGQMMMA